MFVENLGDGGVIGTSPCHQLLVELLVGKSKNAGFSKAYEAGCGATAANEKAVGACPAISFG